MDQQISVNKLPAEIRSEEAYNALSQGQLLLVDVRTPMEWSRTGIAQGAHTISTQNPAFMQELEELTKGDRNAPLGLICATGNRSGMVQRYLKDYGYTNVTNVVDGMMGNYAAPGWIRNNLPVVPVGTGN